MFFLTVSFPKPSSRYFAILELKTCGRLQPPINGNLHGRDTSHGATVSFACFAGFDLFGLRSITCNNGFWSGNVPSCKGKRLVSPDDFRAQLLLQT